MRAKKAKKILKHVKDTYSNIAEDFSNARKAVYDLRIFSKYIKSGNSILDLGCGNGRLFGFIDEVAQTWDKTAEKVHYLGIDNNAELLKLAGKKYQESNFLEGDILNIPIENGTIDTIFSIRAIHHIPSKTFRKEALLEMRRVLKNNGTLIISVWNLWRADNINSIIKAILRCIITFGTYEYNDLFIPWGKKAKRYYHAFTPKELYKLVHEAGFRDIELFGIDKGEKADLSKCADMVIIAKK